MKVVGTLTTIPSRIDNIEPTLQSITNQSYKLDAVYLNIPFTSQREDTEYLIPQELSNYCHIIRCQDYGPITKIVGALLREEDPDTVIITFDDDKIYPEGLVEKLVSKHRARPDCAIGSSGLKLGSFPFYMSFVQNEYSHNNHWYAFDVSNHGEEVDILAGYPGALYVRKFFPDADNLDRLLRYPAEDDQLFRNDDVVISGYLGIKKIPKLVYRLPSIQDGESNANGLSDSRSVFVFSLLKSIWRAKKTGMFKKHVEYTRSKTMTYPVIMGIIVLVILSLLFSTRK